MAIDAAEAIGGGLGAWRERQKLQSEQRHSRHMAGASAAEHTNEHSRVAESPRTLEVHVVCAAANVEIIGLEPRAGSAALDKPLCSNPMLTAHQSHARHLQSVQCTAFWLELQKVWHMGVATSSAHRDEHTPPYTVMPPALAAAPDEAAASELDALATEVAGGIGAGATVPPHAIQPLQRHVPHASGEGEDPHRAASQLSN